MPRSHKQTRSNMPPPMSPHHPQHAQHSQHHHQHHLYHHQQQQADVCGGGSCANMNCVEAAAPPPEEYYFEEMHEEEYIGDYAPEAVDELQQQQQQQQQVDQGTMHLPPTAAPLPPPTAAAVQQQQQREIDPRRALDVTELYRRRCAAAAAAAASTAAATNTADLYSGVYRMSATAPACNVGQNTEYFYDPRSQPSQICVHVAPPVTTAAPPTLPPIHAAPSVYRKRVLSANTVNPNPSPSYHRIMTATAAPPVQTSQTHYLTSEEALALRQQRQQQQYEQFLAHQHQKQLLQRQNMHYHMQQQQHNLQSQNQLQHSQQKNPQEIYRLSSQKHAGHTNMLCASCSTQNGGHFGSVVNVAHVPREATFVRERQVQTNAYVEKHNLNDDERNVIGNSNLMSVNNVSSVSNGNNGNENVNNGSVGNTSGVRSGGASIASGNNGNTVIRMQPGTRSAHQAVGSGHAHAQMRRHPITVRTPRYIRRAINPPLYKRPSALCLPLAVQADPALYGPVLPPRRPRRNASANPLPIEMQPPLITNETSTKNQVGPGGHASHPGHAPLDQSHLSTSTQMRLDSIFKRYDKLFRPETTSAGATPSGDATENLCSITGKPDPLENIDRFDKFENLEKLSKFELQNVKPRTPPCLKERNAPSKVQMAGVTNLTSQKILPDVMKSAETLQVEEITTDMLDELLNELTENGLNDDASVDQRERLVKQSEEKMEEEKYRNYLKDKEAAMEMLKQEQEKLKEDVFKPCGQIKESPEKDNPSFSYAELQQSMARSRNQSACEMAPPTKHTETGVDPIEPEHDIPTSPKARDQQKEEKDKEKDKHKEKDKDKEKERESKEKDKDRTRDRERERIYAHKNESEGDISSKKSISSTTTTSAARSKAKIIPRILVDDAMELHRTKSYVVNLIDTALSNHFGTSGKDAKQKKEKHTKSTIQMLKKQPSTTSSKASQKDLAEEIAHVLSENYASHSRHSTISKGLSQCSCKSSSHEPLFVRQLRQMRWGHLKHIQQEVRRLEELERFLDSCNLSTFEKCHYH